MEPKQTQIKKLVLTALFVAIATYGGSLFSFPIGIAKCAPVQSLVNVLSGIILGPWWALGQALATSILRNLLGTGTVFAFPGSMIGAFLAGWLYQKFKKPGPGRPRGGGRNRLGGRPSGGPAGNAFIR